jgi:hypothetical protein
MQFGSYLSIKHANAAVLTYPSSDLVDFKNPASNDPAAPPTFAAEPNKIEILGFQWKAKLVTHETKRNDQHGADPHAAPVHQPVQQPGQHGQVQAKPVLPPTISPAYGTFWIFKAVDGNSPLIYDLAFSKTARLTVTVYLAPNPVTANRGLLTIELQMAVITSVQTLGSAEFLEFEKAGAGEEGEGEDDAGGELFKGWNEEEPGCLFERVGFAYAKMAYLWKDGTAEKANVTVPY